MSEQTTKDYWEKGRDDDSKKNLYMYPHRIYGKKHLKIIFSKTIIFHDLGTWDMVCSIGDVGPTSLFK